MSWDLSPHIAIILWGKVIRNHQNQDSEENITNFEVIPVPADSLEVLEAVIAADTVETIQ